MSNIKLVGRKDLTAAEVTQILEEGGRVIIELSVLGKTSKVVIRRHSGVYYCDTPMKLLKFEDQNDFQKCLEKFRLVRYDTTNESEIMSASA